MGYTKQNFLPGNILKAAQLNAMDDQIAANQLALENKHSMRITTIGSPQIYTCNVDAEGLSVFENVQAIYDAFDALVAQYPKMFKSNGSLGKDASGTYDIKYYTLGKTNPRITTDRVGNNTNL